jgi:transcription factor C subunit 6
MVSLRPRRSTAGQFREVLSDGEEERSGESDFVPEGADEKETNVSSDAPEEDDVSEEQIDEEEEDRAPKKKKRKPTSEPKFSLVTTNWVPKKSKKANAPSQAGLASNVQARASGPAGSSSGGHYKRPPPLYLRPAPIRRLIEEPKPLGTPRTVPSNSGHGQPLVQSRIAKSWARCIGLGPIWQLIEDRSWFKERAEFDEELETRPCVYEDLELLREQVLLSEE